MMSLIGELKRRKVFRTAIVYLAGAWLVTEVLGSLFAIVGAPDWSTSLVVILLAFMVVPVLIFSWAYKLTPDGLKRDLGDGDMASVSRSTAWRLDRLTEFFIALALLVIVADYLWLDPVSEQLPVTELQSDTGEVAQNGAGVSTHPTSLAVLPFLNMSTDEANQYFSDGITEELISLLSTIPEMRVTSRSSAFSFKDRSIIVPEVAEQLGVKYILEGSVRKAANRVRITTQLIEAGSDTHLWSETYDRTLDDIFAVQEEIAETVVRQLKLTLLGSAPTMKKTSPEAYTAFLKARHLGTRFTADDFEQSNALYQQAVEIDPAYASAWSGLAANYINQTTTGHLSIANGYRMAREAAGKALSVDPDHATTLAQLGIIAIRHDRDLEAAARYLKRALDLDSSNPDILMHAATLNRTLGRMDEAVRLNKEVVGRDPINPVGHYFLGFSYLWAGRLDEAIDSLRTTLMLSPEHVSVHYRIAQALYYLGEPDTALEEARQERRETKRLMGLVMACHALGRSSEADAALDQLIASHERTTAYNIAYLMAFRGDNDRAFEWLQRAVQYNDFGLPQILHQPEFTPIHDDPRWLPFLEGISMAPWQLESIEF